MPLWAAAVTLPEWEERSSGSVGLHIHMGVTTLGSSLASHCCALGWRYLCRGLCIDGLAIRSGAIRSGAIPTGVLAAPRSELLPQGITLTSHEGLGWAPCQV